MRLKLQPISFDRRPVTAYTRAVETLFFCSALSRGPERVSQVTPQKIRMFRSPRREVALGAVSVNLSSHLEDIATMATGTVKFFNTQKGFGFITPTDGSKDVFVHISAVERAGMRTLNEGQRVSYEVVTERGKQAASNLQNA
jgi:CspA family cold shock protein